MKISIIIPIYNVANYLRACLDSVLKQTYRNIEVILINDCSSDGSAEICDDYSLRDKRVKVYHQINNNGVSAARNIGLNLSSGDYVCFVDSDDWIAEDYLEQMLNYAQNKVDVVFVGMYDYYSEDKCIPVVLREVLLSDLRNPRQLLTLLNTPRLPGPCCKLYKKSIIRDNNIEFALDVSFAEDKEFNAKYLRYCNSVYIAPYIGYYYRRLVNNSLSNSFHKDRYITECRIWKLWFDFIQDNHIVNAEINRYFANYLYYILSDSIIGSNLQGYRIPRTDNYSNSFLRQHISLVDDTNILRKYLIAFGAFKLYKLINSFRRMTIK